jgi:hypothetical protein
MEGNFMTSETAKTAKTSKTAELPPQTVRVAPHFIRAEGMHPLPLPPKLGLPLVHATQALWGNGRFYMGDIMRQLAAKVGEPVWEQLIQLSLAEYLRAAARGHAHCRFETDPPSGGTPLQNPRYGGGFLLTYKQSAYIYVHTTICTLLENNHV